MTTQPFNATEILNQLRHRQAVKRKRQFHHSRLMRVRAGFHRKFSDRAKMIDL